MSQSQNEIGKRAVFRAKDFQNSILAAWRGEEPHGTGKFG
jgi:hypothetical protein